MAEKKYKIKITPKANDDLDEIYSYIAKELVNETAAENLMDKIEEKIMRLRDFPFSCSYVEDEVLRNKGENTYLCCATILLDFSLADHPTLDWFGPKKIFLLSSR